MKELAQLPTPTIATRTFSSALTEPLPLFVSLMKLKDSFLSRWVRKHTSGANSLHPNLEPRAELARSSWEGLLQKLVSDVHYALDRRDDGQHRDQVDRWGQELEIAEPGALGEDQADREYDYPDGTRRQPDLALDPERLGAGTRVGDHQRAEHGDHAHRRGKIVAGRSEVAGDRGQHDPLLDPVQGRVEEGAEQRPLARHARVAPVHRVHHRAEDEGDPGEGEEALGHQAGGDEVADQAGDRDRVRRQPRLDQAVARVGAELLPVAGLAPVAAAARSPRGGRRVH